MKIVMRREILHHMMRGLAGSGFQPSEMSTVDKLRMRLIAERLAHATATGEVLIEVTVKELEKPELVT
jgi:hypothetical protein